MVHRFTFAEVGYYKNKQDEKLTDNRILIILINDRISRLDHYSPIKERLIEIRKTLEDNSKQFQCNKCGKKHESSIGVSCCNHIIWKYQSCAN